MAGGKRIASERIEWVVIPDAATASAALQSGEVDWLELVIPDLLPALRRNRNIAADIDDHLGLVGLLLMNHLFPPFNEVRARRAILMAISQEDYMRGITLGERTSAALCKARCRFSGTSARRPETPSPDFVNANTRASSDAFVCNCEGFQTPAVTNIPTRTAAGV